jgi:hypothetical protein
MLPSLFGGVVVQLAGLALAKKVPRRLRGGRNHVHGVGHGRGRGRGHWMVLEKATQKTSEECASSGGTSHRPANSYITLPLDAGVDR